MLHRFHWEGLPDSVRREIQDRLGTISRAVAVSEGQSSSVALTLYRDELPPVFLKGVHGVSREMRWLRNEIDSAERVAGIAPAIVFHRDIGDWLIAVFEHVEGRPVSLAPGSPDLPVVARALGRIGSLRALDLKPLGDRWKTSWWQRIAEEKPQVLNARRLDELKALERNVPDVLVGDHLLHTDLHEDQFVVTSGGDVRVIDWGWPASGAPWVDPAFLVLRLIGAGHQPDAAESWARAHTRWALASDEEITTFAVYVAGLWTYRATTESLARLARDYATWRLQGRFA
jgi:Ser/Thr protein kinase RdoA (MazF antagonist)